MSKVTTYSYMIDGEYVYFVDSWIRLDRVPKRSGVFESKEAAEKKLHRANELRLAALARLAEVGGDWTMCDAHAELYNRAELHKIVTTITKV